MIDPSRFVAELRKEQDRSNPNCALTLERVIAAIERATEPDPDPDWRRCTNRACKEIECCLGTPCVAAPEPREAARPKLPDYMHVASDGVMRVQLECGGMQWIWPVATPADLRRIARACEAWAAMKEASNAE